MCFMSWEVLLYAYAKNKGEDYHYASISVQYTAIFHGCKNGNFQVIKCDIFLILAQNIDHGYMMRF